MAFLDSIKIRRLENGFTVRYHIAPVEHSVSRLPENLAGQTREVFVSDKDALLYFVERLIIENIDSEGES